MQEEGKIKYIGLNNAGVKQLDEAWATGIRFHTLQVRYHMFSRKEIEAEIAPCKSTHPLPLSCQAWAASLENLGPDLAGRVPRARRGDSRALRAREGPADGQVQAWACLPGR